MSQRDARHTVKYIGLNNMSLKIIFTDVLLMNILINYVCNDSICLNYIYSYSVY